MTRRARREVAEETGYTATTGAVPPTVRYLTNGRPKRVRHRAAEAGEGGFPPNTEVDRTLWPSPTAARNRLTQPRDGTLVDTLRTALHLA